MRKSLARLILVCIVAALWSARPQAFQPDDCRLYDADPYLGWIKCYDQCGWQFTECASWECIPDCEQCSTGTFNSYCY